MYSRFKADVAIALCQEGQNLLVPAPGFSLYRTVAHSKAIETRSYRLLVSQLYQFITDASQPDKDWECDLAHMASLIDDNTGAIVITNPSNPCGSVFSKNHLLAILEGDTCCKNYYSHPLVAEKYHVPIIADEIYRGLVFKGEESYELAPLSKKVWEYLSYAMDSLPDRSLSSRAVGWPRSTWCQGGGLAGSLCTTATTSLVKRSTTLCVCIVG